MRGCGPHRPARGGADAEHRATAVVDEGRGSGRAQLAVAARREDRHGLAGATPAVDLGRRAQGSGERVEHGGVPGDALPHGRTGTDHDQRRGLQAGQEMVEIEVAGGRPGDRLTPLLELLESVEVLREQVGQPPRRIGDPALVDLVHERFGPIEGLGHVVGHRVPDLGYLAPDLDQPAQQGVLLDDAGVAPGIGGGGRGGEDLAEHRRTTHGVEQARPSKLVGDGHRVHRLAGGVEGVDGVEHVTVRGLVEVRCRDDPGRGGDRLGRQQHGPEQRLLCTEVVGRHPPRTRTEGGCSLRYAGCGHGHPPSIRPPVSNQRANPGDNLWRTETVSGSCTSPASAGDDFDRDRELHVGVELRRHHMGTERLERLGQLQPTPIEV